MKKLKNPRKYVERLKGQIKWLDEVRERLISQRDRAKGSYWFGWKNPHMVEINHLNPSIDGLHPGDEIIMVGKITEIHQTLEGNSAKMEFTEVRVRK